MRQSCTPYNNNASFKTNYFAVHSPPYAWSSFCVWSRLFIWIRNRYHSHPSPLSQRAPEFDVTDLNLACYATTDGRCLCWDKQFGISIKTVLILKQLRVLLHKQCTKKERKKEEKKKRKGKRRSNWLRMFFAIFSLSLFRIVSSMSSHDLRGCPYMGS